MLKSIQRVWRHLSTKRRKDAVALLLLMLVASLLEVVGIGLVIPLLSVLSNPNKFLDGGMADRLFGMDQSNNLLTLVVGAFSAVAVVTAFLRLFLLKLQVNFSYDVGADFGVGIFSRILHQPYSYHIARNSSESVTSVLNKANSIVVSFIYPMLSLITSLVMLFMFALTLLVVNPIASISICTFFGLIYALILWFSKKMLKKNGEIINKEYGQSLLSLQEGLGGIRDVLLDGTQGIYVNIFKESEYRLRRATAKIQIISGSPKFIVEALGLLFLIIVIIKLSGQKNGFVDVIPIIGFIALAAQRLLPMIQQGYASFSQIRGGHASVLEALDLMDLPGATIGATNGPMNFKKSIKLSKVFFRYSPQSPLVLSEISLEIKRGSRIGIAGITGGGKSTLLDLIMGLHLPSDGEILIDDVLLSDKNQRAWQLNIAHVPQNIYIADTTIAENIAFGVTKDSIDLERIKLSAKQACLDDTIEAWEAGYNTRVGERGVWLSGGQRQRLGIARALYKNCSLLILDEATSSLDYETESKVMGYIKKLSPDLTILMVAHRLSTLEGCDSVVKVQDGQLFSNLTPSLGGSANEI